MAFDRRQFAHAAAFVGDRITLADAEREGGIMIEEERRHVVVVDDEQDLREMIELMLHKEGFQFNTT